MQRAHLDAITSLKRDATQLRNTLQESKKSAATLESERNQLQRKLEAQTEQHTVREATQMEAHSRLVPVLLLYFVCFCSSLNLQMLVCVFFLHFFFFLSKFCLFFN